MGMEWIQLNTDAENICLPSFGMVDRYKYLDEPDASIICVHEESTWK